MDSEFQNVLEAADSSNRDQIINILCQTLLYGIYLCLVHVAIHAMVTNGLQSRARKWLLAITTSMFALTTVYWIVSVVFTFLQINSWNNVFTACYGSDNAFLCIVREADAIRVPAAPWLVFFEDILFINYIITDGVIVWRAWVLCSDHSKIVLMIPVVMLAINTVVYLITIAGRVIQFIFLDLQMFSIITHITSITQVVHLALSLLINIFATSIIALKAWKYHKLLKECGSGIRTPKQTIRILALLVESGMIYILIGVMSVVSIIILTGFELGTLSDLFMLVGIQLAGIYPIVVILLVEKNRSLNSTCGSFGTIIDTRGDQPSQAEPMTFAHGSVLASGGQIDSATKPPTTVAHVTIDYTLEPGDAEKSARKGKVFSEEHCAT